MSWVAAAIVGTTLFNYATKPDPSAPDYGPTAEASKYAADLGYKTGAEQLAEAKRQYDENKKISEPVAAAQLGLMKQQQTQGDEYYQYMLKNQRPLEEAMQREAMVAGSPEQQAEYAGRAIADTTSGYARAQNAAMRQGLRYGYSPERMAAGAARNATSQAVAQAQAANAGRLQSQNLGWAKKLDTAGLYRGLTGASQGAYSLMTNAGNAAVGNKMAPGQAYMSGMGQGAGLQMQGAGMNLQGRTGIMTSQAGMYNAAMGQPGLDVGGLMQGGAALYTAYK